MVIDAAYAPPATGLNGVLLRDWGAHSAGFGRGSDPSGYVDEVVDRYGDYPLPHGYSAAEGRAWGCDVHDGSRPALENLPQRLAEAVALKTRVVLGELEEQDADLVFAVFHEGHCAGHQLWHFMDEKSPWYEPDAPDSLKNGVRSVYVALDRGLAEILERIDPDTHVFVVLTRGMRSHVGGWQLLPEILVRLGYTGAGAVTGSVRSRLPAPVRKTIKSVVRGPLRHRLKSAAGTSQYPLENSRTRAMSVRCGGNGAIRLNVHGREPFGSIQPGDEYDEACAELTRELEALRDAQSDEPVVREVRRADAVFGERYHPNLPDLIVRFRQHGVISSVRSPRIGTVSEPARDRRFARSGEHTAHVRLWRIGPGSRRERRSPEGMRRTCRRPSSTFCPCHSRRGSRGDHFRRETRGGPERGGVLTRTPRPLVSICMPAYNAAPWIGEAIGSALGQTWQDFELVISDDASTDSTLSVASCYRDPRIRFEPNRQHLGQVPNHNRALRLSVGKYMKVPSRRRRAHSGLRGGDGGPGARGRADRPRLLPA